MVRSSVAVLNGSALRYHTAVAFSEDISLCDASLWEPAVAQPPTPPSVGEPPADPAGTDAVPDAELTLVTTLGQTRGELRELLSANDW